MKIRMTVFILALTLLAAGPVLARNADYSRTEGLRTPEMIPDPAVKLIDEEGKGKLYQAGEHKVLVMEGTHREMGYQHGRMLKDNIVHIMTTGYMKKALWDRDYSREYVDAQSARMAKHIPPEIIEEMKGIAEGINAAGAEDITWKDVLIGVTQAEILHFDPDSPPACSNFACWGKWTEDGRLLHGRNLDWNIKGDAQDDHVIQVWRPEGGKPFMMVGWAGGVGSVSGMSSRGITIGEMTLPSVYASFDGIPLMVIMRMILERADNIEEAVAIMKKGPRTSGWNFIIGDAEVPAGRAMEVDRKFCEVYLPADEKENEETAHYSLEDAVRRTNHPAGKQHLVEMARKFGPEFGMQTENITFDQLKLLLPMLRNQNSYQRYDWLGKQIQAREGAIDVAACLQILANGPVYCKVTLHSWVFDPANKAAWVANAGNNPPVTATDRAFTKIDLSQWFE
jgi:hypothetical protein